MSARFQIKAGLAFLLALIFTGTQNLSAQVTVSPSSINFGSIPVGVQAVSSTVTLTNGNSKLVSLTGITFGVPQYTISAGNAAQNIGAHQSVHFQFLFMASQAGTYNSTITFNIENNPGVVLQVSATAVTTTAIASLSANSLSFGTVNFGSTAAAQPVTITNTGGPDSVTIEDVDSYYQPFAVTGPAPPVTLGPGQSATYQVAFSPLVTGSTTSTVTFCYDVLPCNAVDLAGTGATPTALALTNYPELPYGTVGYPYQASMTAAAGTPPYTFRVTAGKLPTGLSLATGGAISGTISSKANTGGYSFTVQVEDSTKLKSTESVTLTVDARTGANCAITSVDVANTNTPIVDLMDLGTGTYMGEEGGLYPDGSNVDPEPHDSDGLAIAQGIQPLDASGSPDPDGSYVLVSIGESASQSPFDQFIEEANADPQKNPSLVIVDGADAGAVASDWASSSSEYWTQLISYSLPFEGVTAQQVVAAWVDDVNSQAGATFPGDAQLLQGNYESIAQLLLQFFPNIKMMFFSSMNYTGYSQGISTTLPEPQAYESAFGAKWAVQDQIDGDPNLNYNAANGPVLAPWMGWSFYYWGNGLIPRSDNITWSCQDLYDDGLHLANPVGYIKVAQYLLNWFKTTDLSAPWFVAPGANKAGR
jgi:hypothetical protein